MQGAEPELVLLSPPTHATRDSTPIAGLPSSKAFLHLQAQLESSTSRPHERRDHVFEHVTIELIRLSVWRYQLNLAMGRGASPKVVFDLGTSEHGG